MEEDRPPFNTHLVPHLSRRFPWSRCVTSILDSFLFVSGSYLIGRCRKHGFGHIHGLLDRGGADNPLGLASLQGLTEELELTGNKYNIALVSFDFSPFLPC